MPTRTPTVREVSFAILIAPFTIASYYMGERWCPAVFEKNGGYSIRVIKSESRSAGSATVTYDYFELDADGLVTVSPRGWAKDFTKRVRVTGIAEVAKRYAEPDPNAPRFRLGF